uniref:Uncharacterized protein n=1 Tax=Avena sativa TaxID=4498 RepID=A0ACD5ZF51_AVESA
MDEKMRPEMVEVADRLRMIRKALPQRKCESSTGSNARVPISGEENNAPPSNTTTPTLNSSSKIPPTVAPFPRISMDELRQITRNFSNDALLGEGMYGWVFFGVLKDGQQCAVKKLDPSTRIHFEVPSISRLKHENIVQLLGYCVEGKDRFLAYEYALWGSLYDILHGKKGVKGAEPGAVLSWEQRAKIALSAAEGLEFLHEKTRPPVIHGRINSCNILLFGDGVAKIGDAGFAISPLTSTEKLLLDPPLTSSVYDAPDFGIVLLELLTGRKAVDRTMPLGQKNLFAIWASARCKGMVERCIDPTLEGNCPPKAVAKMAQIADRCLLFVAKDRPNMNAVVMALRPLLAMQGS